ncbi:MAG: hypothetical protein HKN43_14530 [Rhodothermales bacterium]|nr:hypothetical protein [Rhodothermales bacterium]
MDPVAPAPLSVMSQEDPFRNRPWTAARAELADRIWRLHERASQNAPESELTELRSALEEELDFIPDSHEYLKSVATTPLNSYPFDAEPGVASEWIKHYAIALGRLLAGIADIRSEWQLVMVDDLAKGFFYARRILNHRAESQSGVNVFGDRNERSMWRESVRAKNYLADGMTLARDLPGKYRVELKRSVLVVLELLRQAEKSNFDIDVSKTRIGFYHHMQISLLARFGRATFKS